MPLPGQSPPAAAAVVDVMWTVNVELACVVPAGTVTPFEPPQDRTPAAIEQLEAQPAPVVSIVHDRPGLVGSVSLSFTPCASPSPVFQTVIVKPIGSPTVTFAASAVFRTWIAAPCTTTGSAAHPDVADPLFASPLYLATQ